MVELSLSKVVQYLIEGDPSIQDSLERGYANISAVARLLKPKVEEILGRKVNLSGLITAVKRVKAKHKPLMEQLKIIANSIIMIKAGLAKISIEKTRRNLERARLLSAEFPDIFLQVLEGSTVLTLIMDQRILNHVKSRFEDTEIIDEKQNLAAVIIQSPKEIIDTPGCISTFYNAIARRGINIEETISCCTDTVIVLGMSESVKAYGILTDLIARAGEEIMRAKSPTRFGRD